MLDGLPVVACGSLDLSRRLYSLMPFGVVGRWLFAGKCPTRDEALVEIPMGEFTITLPSSWLFDPVHPMVSLGLGYMQAEMSVLGAALTEASRAKDPGVVLDVGGNMGYVALRMRRYTKLPIISFEPNPFVFELNRLNLARNASRCPDIQGEMLGCSDAPMEATLHCGINSAIEAVDGPTTPFEECRAKPFAEMMRLLRSGKVVATIRCVRLDDHLTGPPVRFVKIDVEGFELHVLRGATRLLTNHKPGLFIELHPKALRNLGSSVEEVVAFLENLGYTMTFYCFYHPPARGVVGRALRHFNPPRPQQFATWEEARARSIPDSEQYHMVAMPK